MKNSYETPDIQVVEVQVEKGFAESPVKGGTEPPGEKPGGWSSVSSPWENL